MRCFGMPNRFHLPTWTKSRPSKIDLSQMTLGRATRSIATPSSVYSRRGNENTLTRSGLKSSGRLPIPPKRPCIDLQGGPSSLCEDGPLHLNLVKRPSSSRSANQNPWSNPNSLCSRQLPNHRQRLLHLSTKKRWPLYNRMYIISTTRSRRPWGWTCTTCNKDKPRPKSLLSLLWLEIEATKMKPSKSRFRRRKSLWRTEIRERSKIIRGKRRIGTIHSTMTTTLLTGSVSNRKCNKTPWLGRPPKSTCNSLTYPQEWVRWSR